MEVGLIGKPNVGKSTLFNALTLLNVPVGPYPFTTIDPNRGVSYVRFPCPHSEKGGPCTPGNSACEKGVRHVPVHLVDVAGLVPGAHAGKGKGNQFLDNLRQADGYLHVVDLSGSTTPEAFPPMRMETNPAPSRTASSDCQTMSLALSPGTASSRSYRQPVWTWGSAQSTPVELG